MDGKAGGSYLIGRETKAKPVPLSTPPVNGPAILTIKVLPFVVLSYDHHASVFKLFAMFFEVDLSESIESLFGFNFNEFFFLCV